MAKKRIFTRILSLSMVFVIVFTSFAFAQDNVIKDETVYVNLTREGKIKDITVSDWVHSNEKDVEIQDKSILTDIKNVKGNEVPVKKDDKLTWKTDKGEIYYQGRTDKELPLSFELTYILDGKKIEPELLAGKSGKLKMTVKVINNEFHDVTINGKIKKLYAPFAVITVINMPTSKCRNLEVNTGKVLNDGNNTIITYIASPGLKESLDIDDEDFDDIFDMPEMLELEADVEDFEMGDILITAESDSSILDEIKKTSGIIDETIDGVNDLTDASDDVKSGITDLDDGTKKLLDNFGDFKGGIYTLKDAAELLNENVNGRLLNGTKELTDGTDEFADKLVELKDGTEKLLEGSEDLYDGTKDAYFGVSQLKSGSRDLVHGIDEFQQQIGQSSIDTDPIKTAVESAVQDAVDKAIKGVIAQGIITDEQKPYLEQAGAAAGKAAGAAAGEGVKVALDEKIGGFTMLLNGGIQQLSTGAGKLYSGLDTCEDGMKELSNGANDLKNGINELDDNVGLFVDGADVLIDGAHELSDGLEALSQGTSSLKDGVDGIADASNLVNDGISDLKDGTKTLNDGYDEFDKDGVIELHDKVIEKTDEYNEVFEIKDQLAVLSSNYNNYSGKDESMEGTVKFVMKIDSIELEEVQKEEPVKEEKEGGFINWLKEKWNSIFN